MPVENLAKIVSFENFSYRDYIKHEETILTPQLRALGYSKIFFVDGEADNFGPLSRLCRCRDRNGKKREFWYG